MDEHAQDLTAAVSGVDWVEWMRRWDVQQTGYLPNREARFDIMLDVLEALLPSDFVALDLCCGPGSISQRLLSRFPHARSIAADLDPLLMVMGRAVLGDASGRLRWVEVDLMTVEDLGQTLGVDHVDAVLSTTALHWLPVENLVRLYRQLGRLVRSGGVFLNGDHIRFAPNLPAFDQVCKQVKDRRHRYAFEEQGVEDWDEWWQAVEAVPALQPLLAERERRFTWRSDDTAPTIDLHLAALQDAGFRQVDTIWQYYDNRIVMAVR